MIVYLNGEFMNRECARIPVMERGFLFGDGVYEVVPAYGGELFRFERHMARLRRSLDAIHLDPGISDEELRGAFETLLNKNGGGSRSIYLQITRGPAPDRDHAFPTEITPTIFAMTTELPSLDSSPDPKGISVITAEDIRWQRCDIKAITLLANCLLKEQARERGADETILVRDGYAMEATAANLFLVSGGEIITPAKDEHILPGVTRDLLVEMALERGLLVTERPIRAGELANADEIWLTSTTKEIRPVTRLNDKPVGDGVAGPVWHEINDLYQQLKHRLYRGEVQA